LLSVRHSLDERHLVAVPANQLHRSLRGAAVSKAEWPSVVVGSDRLPIAAAE
jgi:hypothetical protein